MMILTLGRLKKSLAFDAFLIALQCGAVNPGFAGSFKSQQKPAEKAHFSTISDQEILKGSQISYRAEGGFTAVQSYGVILSCVNGHVSVMKSIYDPRLSPEKARTREIGSMDPMTYVALWNHLDRESLFEMKDAPAPRLDIRDEFTVHFYAKVGDTFHQFDVYGISRPEAARYFAVRELIDQSVNMQALWNAYQDVAKSVNRGPASTQED